MDLRVFRARVCVCVATLLVAGFAPGVRAQLVSYQKGVGYSSVTTERAPVYKVTFRQFLHDDWSATVDYINEGHYTGHHPDGYDLKLGYTFGSLGSHPVSFSIGAGAFYYFDTATPDGGISTDMHGFSPVISATLWGQIVNSPRWRWLLSADAVTRDVKTTMMMVGVGYWMEDAPRGGHPLALLDRGSDRNEPDEISLYGLLDVVNISGNPNAWGGSAEFRHSFARYFEGTLTYLYEGDPKVTRRQGWSAQLWPVRSSGSRGFEIGFGFGGYVFTDRKQSIFGSQAPSATVAPIVSIMLSHPLTRHWFVRTIFDRVITSYSRDADIWRLGVGRSI